jgi:hypothetical protein
LLTSKGHGLEARSSRIANNTVSMDVKMATVQVNEFVLVDGNGSGNQSKAIFIIIL